VSILLFNSGVKFHSKICMHCWNMKKSSRGFFLTCPVDIHIHLCCAVVMYGGPIKISTHHTPYTSMWCKKTGMWTFREFVCMLSVVCDTLHECDCRVNWWWELLWLCVMLHASLDKMLDSWQWWESTRTSAAVRFSLLRWFVEVG